MVSPHKNAMILEFGSRASNHCKLVHLLMKREETNHISDCWQDRGYSTFLSWTIFGQRQAF
jgi:hypothetical protein